MIMHDAKIYLCKPDRTPICELNGKQVNDIRYKRNLKDFNKLTLSVDRYIDIDGQLIESNGYNRLKDHMVLYLENLDYFQLQEPTIANDGRCEYKMLEAYSDEKSFEDKDMKGIYFNKGTTDSMEMLADNNVDDLGFAKEYITFCNEKNHQLSLMHLVLDFVPGWTLGYIDPVLANEKYSFEAENTNVYAFLNTTVANTVQCIFYFDTIKRTVSVYSKENIGMTTNIFIGWRNVLNSIKQTAQNDTLYNCLTVEGDENLDIRAVNYGNREIYDLDYYLTTDYFKQETIDKIKKWIKWRKDNRKEYIDNAKQVAKLQAEIDEITYRVPVDGCNVDQYKTMDKETLEKTLKMYEQMMTTLQVGVDTRDDHEKDSNGNYVKWDKPDDIQNRVYKPWTTSSGEIDHERYMNLLKQEESGYYTYLELKEYVIPNIKIAIENYQVPEDKKKDYNEEWEINWDLYGIKELEGKRDEFNKQILVILAKYQKDWNDMTDEEKNASGVKDEESYNVFHNEFIKYKGYLGDEDTEGTLLYKLKELNTQVDELTKTQDDYQAKVTSMNEQAAMNHSQFGLTDTEYIAVQNIIRMGDYTNNNILSTSLDDAVTTFEHKEELYQDGLDRIKQTSSPQYQFTTSLDNLLSLNEYANTKDNNQGWHDKFDIGNFIFVGVRDDYAVKLRLFTIAYNPCTKNSEIEVTYTNMLNHLTGVNDFTYLFEDAVNDLKNSISLGTGNAKDSVEYMSNMLQWMMNTSAFKNGVNNSVSNGTVIGAVGDYLDYKTIKVDQLIGNDAQFNTLFSKYINSEYIKANSVDVQNLLADVAKINSALIGTSSTETGFFINLNAKNTKIDEAWISNLVANNITVSDLVAGDITLSDKMRILSENGNLVFSGNTLQFLNSKNEVGIQIGYGTGENPSLIIKDENGATILTSQGITANAITDGLIVNNMLKDSTIEKEKLGFNVIEPNEYGGIGINQIYDGNGNLWGEKYKETISGITTDISDLNNKTESNSNDIKSLRNDMSSISLKVPSIELSGQQVFTETNDIITPDSITIVADVKNGAAISKWYIDGVENTTYVSQDKTSITIPSSFMKTRKTIVLKVECVDTALYDVMTLYKAIDGSDAYTVTISSSKGTLFECGASENYFLTDENNTQLVDESGNSLYGNLQNISISTVCTCIVYKGSTVIDAKGYTWYKKYIDSNWTKCGTGKEIELLIDKNAQIKCSVDV
nr:MAG TPA: tail protein [Bacteriophage sp.]